VLVVGALEVLGGWGCCVCSMELFSGFVGRGLVVLESWLGGFSVLVLGSSWAGVGIVVICGFSGSWPSSGVVVCWWWFGLSGRVGWGGGGWL